MDFIVDLPETPSGSNILVITDRLTKQPIFIPIDRIEAADVAYAFLRFVYAYHGLPKAIVSDRGP
jgi:hypothetical protein